jgi:hypothetical protein
MKVQLELTTEEVALLVAMFLVTWFPERVRATSEPLRAKLVAAAEKCDPLIVSPHDPT